MRAIMMATMATIVAWMASSSAYAQPPLNLGFEQTRLIITRDDPLFKEPQPPLKSDPQDATPLTPTGWSFRGEREGAILDTITVHSGNLSLRLCGKEDAGSVSAYHAFPAAMAAGKRLRLSGYIKSQDIGNGHAGFRCLVYGKDGRSTSADVVVADAWQKDNPVRGTTSWTKYQIELQVDQNAGGIHVGCYLVGKGTAWFDTLTIDLDGLPYERVFEQRFPDLTQEQLDWLVKNSRRLKTPAPGSGFDDLQWLKQFVGDARIVALGEATHGTKEFFQMKHRLIEFLVQEMGFTAVAVEGDMPEAYRINDCIRTGEGDLKKLLDTMTPLICNTQEVLDMLSWMQRINHSGAGHVQFWGFDIYAMGAAMSNVRRFIAKVDPSYLESLDETCGAFSRRVQMPLAEDTPGWEKVAAMKRMGDLSRDEKQSYRDRLHKILAHMEQARPRYSEQAPTAEVDWVIQNARLIGQTATKLLGNGDTAFRDLCMADNVGWLLQYLPKRSRIVLWAHNDHVARRGGTMGMHLAKRHGKDLVVLGMTCYAGRYNAGTTRGTRRFAAHPMVPSYRGSVEWYLHQAAVPGLFLDLRAAARGDSPCPWLASLLDMRGIGVMESDWQFRRSRVAQEFDGIIFFDNTTPSTLLGKRLYAF